MKRYLLFSGDTYYPVGGWEDFRGSFATMEAAAKEANNLNDDWWHVVDSQTGQRVIEDGNFVIGPGARLPGAVSR